MSTYSTIFSVLQNWTEPITLLYLYSQCDVPNLTWTFYNSRRFPTFQAKLWHSILKFLENVILHSNVSKRKGRTGYWQRFFETWQVVLSIDGVYENGQTTMAFSKSSHLINKLNIPKFLLWLQNPVNRIFIVFIFWMLLKFLTVDLSLLYKFL